MRGVLRLFLPLSLIAFSTPVLAAETLFKDITTATTEVDLDDQLIECPISDWGRTCLKDEVSIFETSATVQVLFDNDGYARQVKLYFATSAMPSVDRVAVGMLGSKFIPLYISERFTGTTDVFELIADKENSPKDIEDVFNRYTVAAEMTGDKITLQFLQVAEPKYEPSDDGKLDAQKVYEDAGPDARIAVLETIPSKSLALLTFTTKGLAEIEAEIPAEKF